MTPDPATLRALADKLERYERRIGMDRSASDAMRDSAAALRACADAQERPAVTDDTLRALARAHIAEDNSQETKVSNEDWLVAFARAVLALRGTV